MSPKLQKVSTVSKTILLLTFFWIEDGVSRLVLYFNIERELGTGLGKIIWVFPSLMKGSHIVFVKLRIWLFAAGEVIGFEFCSEILSMKNEAQAGDGTEFIFDDIRCNGNSLT